MSEPDERHRGDVGDAPVTGTRRDEMGREYAVHLDHLDEPTCLRLLARARFGRLGTVLDEVPVVLPVNCAVVRTVTGPVIVVRTRPGSSVDRAADGRVVAFETDHVDVTAESGWSVLVRGRAERWDPRGAGPSRAELEELDLHPWAPGDHDRWIAVRAEVVTGRIVSRHRVAPAGVHLPSMPPD